MTLDGAPRSDVRDRVNEKVVVDDRDAVYALGVGIRTDKVGRLYGHGGFFPGYNSSLAYYPEHRIAVAMQINTDESRVGAHAERLAQIVVEHAQNAVSWADAPQ